MNKKWFLCYREKDNAYFFFNGVWPVQVSPEDTIENRWVSDSQHQTQASQVEVIEKDVPMLQEVLNSNKRVFKAQGSKYIICERGEFLPPNE